jgi:Putative peptidoglycan binding domain/CHAP domain
MPAASDILGQATAKLGLGETPPGSNHNEITEWYGMDGPWCAMFVSFCLAHGGFSSDGGATLNLPGIVKTTAKGWAYVPSLLNNLRTAGWFVSAPQPGDIVIYEWDGGTSAPDHTGLVESVLPDGSITAIEGNRNDEVERVSRNTSVIVGFGRIPYDGVVPRIPPPVQTPAGLPRFPGYCSLGSVDTITRRVQQRLKDRGWTIGVDGIFGSETDRVVRGFQQNKGLDADGVVGPLTWNALFGP